MTFSPKTVLLILFGLSTTILAPLLISSKFQLDVLTLIFFTAYIGQSWNILGGYAGQFSFGGVMFFGTGAYTSSILLTTTSRSPSLSISRMAAPLDQSWLSFGSQGTSSNFHGLT